jgi:hypothetical protein
MLTYLVLMLTYARAQNLPADFGTPQGTARLAASSGFVDILGIKLGMPAEEALAMLKAKNPTARITFERTRDYESAWIWNLPRTDPKREFVTMINVEPTQMPGDNVSVSLSIPPSKQVVQGISRTTQLQAPVAIENIVAGLRKKYGTETAGVNFKPNGIPIFDGISKTLVWVFDTEGRQLGAETIAKETSGCANGMIGGMGAPTVSIRRFKSDDRVYSLDQLKQIRCYGYVILTAMILTDGPTLPELRGTTRSFSVTVYHWPLIANSANAFYAFLDQNAQRDARKADQDAKQRGGDVKY